jgi:cyclohexanone monooxygenase
MSGTTDYDAVVVGAGFGGLHMLHRLRQEGLRVRLYEAGDQVGGTWYWNRYPGARCDFESFDYSYSFDEDLQQDWVWPERYATQPEILRYLNHVADRFGLREDIVLGTRVTAARYTEADQVWTVHAGGAVRTRLLILATGALSTPQIPDIPGAGSFRGRILHTAAWPAEAVEFAGERVAVVGTGSSGAQVIPRIARQARQLHVLQRTPSFVVPARNRRLTEDDHGAIKANYPAYRERARTTALGVYFQGIAKSALEATPEERAAAYESRWQAGGGLLGTFSDLLTDPAANETLADFLRAKIAELVHDDDTAKQLTPYGFPVGAKRLVVEDDYYATFNRDNVELVDLRTEPLEEITSTGVRIGARQLELDTIVFATGFDALTGPLRAIDLHGTGGTLADAWSAGPVTYLGLASAGFPNLLVVGGPDSPAVLTNVVRTTEQQVEWITALVRHLRDHGLERVEARPEAQRDWGAHVQEVAAATLFTKADSWYLGANISGKPRVFMPYAGGLPQYTRICAEVAASGYEGFRLT